MVGEFGVEKSILDMFFLFSIYKLILAGIGGGNNMADGIADGGLRRIFSISFFKDLTIL